MKNLTLALILAASATTLTSNAHALDEYPTRTFTVDWSQTDGGDSDVQMCDDTYYDKLEILIPMFPEGVDIRDVVKQSGLKLVRKDKVSVKGKPYIRLLLDGSWDAQIVIEKPRTERSPRRATYTIYISDAC